MTWLATEWTVENRDAETRCLTLYPNCEIALEEGSDDKPVMTKDGVVFLMALPKHLARKNSMMSFNWYGNIIEVWEGLTWIGNLHLTKVTHLE